MTENLNQTLDNFNDDLFLFVLFFCFNFWDFGLGQLTCFTSYLVEKLLLIGRRPSSKSLFVENKSITDIKIHSDQGIVAA